MLSVPFEEDFRHKCMGTHGLFSVTFKKYWKTERKDNAISTQRLERAG
jgi:hypothetical protein